MSDPKIELKDVSVEFSMYGNRSASLKEWCLHKARQVISFNKFHHNELRFDGLSNMNLEAHSGETVGIVGLNGSGKSTLLKVINGIYVPKCGTVEVVGDIAPLIELGTGFDIQLTGRENIVLNWSMLGRPLKQLRSVEQEIISFAELEDFIDMPVKYYSSGMTARLAFAIASAIQTQILLIDEIFSTGDERFVEKATSRMLELVSNANIVFLVSHNLPLIERVATRVLVMHQGRLAAQGPPSQMLSFYLDNIVHGDAGKQSVPNAGVRPGLYQNNAGSFSD